MTMSTRTTRATSTSMEVLRMRRSSFLRIIEPKVMVMSQYTMQ